MRTLRGLDQASATRLPNFHSPSVHSASNRACRSPGRNWEDRAETWFWGVSFRVTNRKSYGYAVSLEEAKAAFRAEYLAWKTSG